MNYLLLKLVIKVIQQDCEIRIILKINLFIKVLFCSCFWRFCNDFKTFL